MRLKLSCVGLVVATAAQAQVPVPTFIDIGFPPGTVGSSASGINDLGDVVGQVTIVVAPPTTALRAFRWSNGALVQLVTVPGKPTTAHYFATDVNDVGQTSGWVNTGIGQALLWNTPSVVSVIPKLPGCLYSTVGHDIDNFGNVVGTSCLDPMVYQSSTGFLTPLQDLTGGNYLHLNVNDSGEVIGYGTDTNNQYRALYWGPSGASMLNVVAPMTLAEGINDLGQIVGSVGSSVFPNGPQLPTRWDPVPGGFTETTLALPPGWTRGKAARINNVGQVIGRTWDTSGNVGSVMWDVNGVVIDLEQYVPAGWSLASVADINNWGQICGTAQDPQGANHAVVITPFGLGPPPPPPPPAMMLAPITVSANRIATFSVTGAVPGDTIYIIDDTGAVYTSQLVACPQPPPGGALASPFIGSATASSTGLARIRIKVRPTWSGQTRTFVATDPGGCLISNLQSITFP